MCILHIIIFVWGGIYYFNTDKNLYLSDEVEGINQTFQPGTVLETNKIIHSYFHSKKIYYISQYEFQNLVMWKGLPHLYSLETEIKIVTK